MKYTTRGVYFPTIYAVQAILIGITGRLFDLPVLIYLLYLAIFPTWSFIVFSFTLP